MTDGEGRAKMLGIVEQYQLLAERATQRLKNIARMGAREPSS
jgi:hypothetical protein